MPIVFRRFENWNLELVSKFEFRVSDLIGFFLSFTLNRQFYFSVRNQVLQRDVTMPLVGFGPLFVAQHPKGLDQLGTRLLGLDDTVHQHVGCGMIGV